MLNPIGVIITASLELSSLIHLPILAFIYSVNSHNKLLASLSVGLIAYLNPPYLPLISAWIYAYKTGFRVYIAGAVTAIGLYWSSIMIAGSGHLWNCQLSLMMLEDPSPSISMFWYYLLEIFEKYKLLYQVIGIVHPYLYIQPIFMILSKHRYYTGLQNSTQLYFSVMLGICMALHPHPTLYDLSLFSLIMLSNSNIISKVESNFITVLSKKIPAGGLGLVISMVMWVMWERRVGGNANFLFFQNVLYNAMLFGFLFGIVNQIYLETIKVMSR